MSIADRRRLFEGKPDASPPPVVVATAATSPKRKLVSGTSSLGRATGQKALAQSISSVSDDQLLSQPPPRPPKKKPDDVNERRSAPQTASDREALLEKKIIELQMNQMQLIERLATYEQYVMTEDLRREGAAASGGSGSASNSKNDLLSKLRGKIEKSKTRKEAQHVLESSDDMDPELWSQKKNRKIRLDMQKLEILHPLTNMVGGSMARLHVVEVDGFVCVMKELDIAFAREMSANLVKTFEAEVQFLENLPAHPNIVRYLFHTFDHEKGRARLFMTKYALSLRDELTRRQSGIGDVAAGIQWCHCCPKCTTVVSGRAEPMFFSLLEAATILLDIAQGLFFLHFHQVLHRDLKSDNIFVKIGPTGAVSRVLIGDFDSAKSMREMMNQRYSTVGTPGYIAPEIWSQDTTQAQYTYAADVYSFGILIFELLSFRRPFQELRGIAIQEQLMDSVKTYQHLVSQLKKKQLDEYVPLLQLFQQCVAVEPSERPTVSFIILSLKNVLAMQSATRGSGAP